MTYSSRLLQSLDQQIQQCTDRTERSRLISRRAIYFARLNKLESARDDIAGLRAEIGTSLDPASGAWIILAEGVIEYFEFQLDMAYDRLRRAYAISKSTGVNTAIAASSSWLAHVAAERGDYKLATSHLQESASIVEKSDLSTKSRIFQVAGVLFGDANLMIESQHNFKQAHFLATEEGDESALGALLYNKTVNRLVNSMLADALNTQLPDYFDLLSMEVNSSAAFDSAFNGIGLKEYPLLFKGHILSIKKEYAGAANILENLSDTGLFLCSRPVALADMAYCQTGLNKFDLASQNAQSALDSISDCKGVDDRAFVHGRLSQVFERIGERELCSRHKSLADQNEHEFRSQQKIIANLLQGFKVPE